MQNGAEIDIDGDLEKTPAQRRALHLYFQKIAESLNDAGLDMRKVLKPEVDIPWTKESVKKYMWKPIQRAMFDFDSTEDLSRKQIDPIFNTLNRHIAKFGIHQPFPSVEALIEAARIERINSIKRKNNKK